MRSKAGDFTGSRLLYEAALGLAPRLPPAHYNLGNDLLHQGRLREAVKSYRRALRLHPNDVWALNNRGLVYCRSGKADRARSDFEAALAIEPGFRRAAENLGKIGTGCPTTAGE